VISSTLWLHWEKKLQFKELLLLKKNKQKDENKSNKNKNSSEINNNSI